MVDITVFTPHKERIRLSMRQLYTHILSFLFSFFFLAGNFLVSDCYAQPGKDGALTVTGVDQVLNRYTIVTGNVTLGTNTITVTNIATHLGGLSCGDLILVIQMQGASISSADNATYGNITNYNNAGNYEYKYVKAVNGNTIRVEGTFANSYTASGHVQVIKVPQYTTLIINAGASVTATPWNGQTGGVVALTAQNTITVNGTIQVDTAGFRGGKVDPNTSTDTGGPYAFYKAIQNTGGGEKGESIAGFQTDYDLLGGRYGRGAPANGGGGGNAHNAGGGGGANGNNGLPWTGQGVMCATCTGAAAWALDPGFIANSNARTNSSGGGRGGYTRGIQEADALTNPPSDVAWGPNYRFEGGGIGGRPLVANTTNRIFLGGGGGAGDANNNSGADGGNGGGIIYLLAPVITGTGVLSANGENGGDTQFPHIDAPSGGGAGGSIVIQSTSLTGLSLRANGGKGGDQGIPFNSLSFPESEGPGGGGGGGYVAVPSGHTAAISINSGSNGITNTFALTEFPANGSTSGNTGLQTTWATTPLVFNTTICQKPQLAVAKKANLATPIQEGTTRTFTYTIEVSNTGTGTATEVEIRDNLAAIVAPGVAFTGNFSETFTGTAAKTATVTPPANSTNLVFGTYMIPAASSVQLSFEVTFAATVPIGTYNNSAQVFLDDPTSVTPVKVSPGGIYADTNPVTGSNYDGSSSTAEDVAVIGNLPPVGQNTTVTTPEDTPYPIKPTDFGYSDPENDAWTNLIVSTLPTKGILELVIGGIRTPIVAGQVIPVAQVGNLVYTPPANESGSPYTSFTFQVQNSLAISANSYTFTIQVTPVNDPPVANPDNATTSEDTPVAIDVKANDTDIDSNLDPKTVVITTPPAHGTVSVNPTTGVVTYTPDPNYSGPDSFQYTIKDIQGAVSNVATVSLTVTPVNDPPVAQTIADTLINPNLPSAPLPLKTTILDKKLFATDVDGAVQTYTIVSVPATGRLFYLNNGLPQPVAANTLLTPAQAATLSYETSDGYAGIVSFTYLATDANGASSSTATYTLTVINIPVALDDRGIDGKGIRVLLGSGIPVVVATNDTDLDKGRFTPAFSELNEASVQVLIQPKHGSAMVQNGVIVYTSSGEFSGKDSLTYLICDRTPTNVGLGKTPLCDTAVVVFTILEPFIPNGFTPNGDGQHDYFIVENPTNEPLELKIFNRWGALVYETSDFQQDVLQYGPDEKPINFSTARSDWQGQSNRGVRIGEDLPDGTYFAVIKYKTSGFSKTKSLTIIR